MSDTPLSRGELVVRTIAQTAVDNETYFCELDAVVGDGDFGYSLARGFEIVLSDWEAMEYSDIGGLLRHRNLRRGRPSPLKIPLSEILTRPGMFMLYAGKILPCLSSVLFRQFEFNIVFKTHVPASVTNAKDSCDIFIQLRL